MSHPQKTTITRLYDTHRTTGVDLELDPKAERMPTEPLDFRPKEVKITLEVYELSLKNLRSLPRDTFIESLIAKLSSLAVKYQIPDLQLYAEMTAMAFVESYPGYDGRLVSQEILELASMHKQRELERKRSWKIMKGLGGLPTTEGGHEGGSSHRRVVSGAKNKPTMAECLEIDPSGAMFKQFYDKDSDEANYPDDGSKDANHCCHGDHFEFDSTEWKQLLK